MVRSTMPPPGYTTLAEFAKKHGLAYMTAKNHMLRGVCKWPRKIDSGIVDSAYKCWECMVQRCTNPKSTGYRNYGGRGITLFPLWKVSFKEFIKYIGPRPSLDYSIDRINVNGHYEPGNVRWATYSEQNSNRRIKPVKHGRKWRVTRQGIRYVYDSYEDAMRR